MIELFDLRVRREGRLVLSIDRFVLPKGQILSVIGPNGAGKSTLLLVLAGLLPFEGTYRFDGVQVRWGDLRLRRRIAMVLQDPLLLSQTVAQNVAAGLRFRHVPRAEREKRVDFWLERLGILPLKQRRKGLSGGEAQRVSLARALALEPELLLLDESFSALDPLTRSQLISDLRPLLAQTGTTALFVTHDRGEALMLGDRIAVLSGGELLQEGPPDEVFNAPATAEVAALVGVETIQSGRIVGHEEGMTVVKVGTSLIRVAGEAPFGCAWVCLRPEDVILHRGALGTTSMRNHLTGTVTGIVSLGGPFRVTVDAGFPVVALITKQAFLELDLAVGGPIDLSFKAHAVHLIPLPS